MRRADPSAGVAVNTVNLEKLSKQLRRDIAANPKKAALLGLMVVVALYFWGPLVWKFVSAANGKHRASTNLANVILTDDPPEAAQTGKSRAAGKFRWDKVQQLIRQDAHMASAAFDPAWLDPFGKAGPEKGDVVFETPSEDPAAIAAAAEALLIDPKDLGIVLGGVMIGPRSRLATINGEACREGETISVGTKGEKTTAIEFRVHRISRQSVQLERRGRIFTLELTTPKLGSGDEFKTAQSK